LKFNAGYVLLILLSFSIVSAAPVVRLNFGNGFTYMSDAIDECNTAYWFDTGTEIYDYQIVSNCTSSIVELQYDDQLDLVFGPVQADEVQTGNNWIYVDTFVRPDLDLPATVTFLNHGFVTRPRVQRNGVFCEGTYCNLTTFNKDEAIVRVDGFSNYSLTARQDFLVWSDPEPELKDKTYQTVDLNNDTKRAGNYSCIVQIFGRNEGGDWVLIQTNPERHIQSRLFGSPDQNQPESLGYFPVKNGLANTYFRGDELFGYMDFTMVVQCASDSELLIYEEPIYTQYSPAGRWLVSRGIWLSDGSNSVYMIFYVLGGLITLWVVILVIRRTFRRY
jgi:hypothetical protein